MRTMITKTNTILLAIACMLSVSVLDPKKRLFPSIHSVGPRAKAGIYWGMAV